MPDLQALYEEWGENEGDLVVLGVAAPKAEDSLYPADNKSAEEIAAWLDEQGLYLSGSHGYHRRTVS